MKITSLLMVSVLAAALCTAAACTYSPVAAANVAVAAAPAAPAADDKTTLLQFDFNGANAWPDMAAGRGATAERKPVGTIDKTGSAEASGGVRLAVAGSPAKGSATLQSGLLAVRNTEADVAKLTLSFSLSVSAVRPVTVRIESFDAGKKRTGGREALVYPAAPDFHQRFALDLSTMKAVGGGAFQPTAPFVRLSFETDSPETRLDNVHYARPAYYVSAKGDDKNDGRTEKTAFATPQKALDAAGPGDIVLVMNGTYTPKDVQEGVASFRRAGTPAAWVSLKNYPGHTPLFSAVGAWSAVKIGQRGTKDAPSTAPALAYIEVRGLHIRGDADAAKAKYAALIGEADPRTNANAVNILGRFETNKTHHVRIADNRIELCAGAGISAIEADRVTIENNVVRDNCWWMIYAGSGISILDVYNFDTADNVYKIVVRNNRVSGNRCFVPWRQIKKISDGNGIILDSNYVPASNRVYRGRTLIQNNLVFNNGGSGIHSFKSHRVDIINNTAYLNGASPELRWGQIFIQRTSDARLINNVLLARDGQPVNTVSAHLSDKENTNVLRASNLYFGGGTPPIMGENDVIADPQFVRPSTDPAIADFRLKADLAAIGTGRAEPFGPLIDLDGKPRRLPPTKGAFEH